MFVKAGGLTLLSICSLSLSLALSTCKGWGGFGYKNTALPSYIPNVISSTNPESQSQNPI